MLLSGDEENDLKPVLNRLREIDSATIQLLSKNIATGRTDAIRRHLCKVSYNDKPFESGKLFNDKL